MKKLFFILLAILALQSRAAITIQDTVDFTTQQRLVNYGFLPSDFQSFHLYQFHVIESQYGATILQHFGFLNSDNSYFFSAMNASNSYDQFGENYAGFIELQANQGYRITQVVVGAPTQLTATYPYITNDLDQAIGSGSTSGTNYTWSIVGGETAVRIHSHDDQGKYLQISSIIITYEVDESVEINAVNFPDAFFRNYVGQYLDSNHDGWLQMSEAQSIAAFDGGLDEKGITSLKGIEYFTELITLKAIYNQLTEIDLSHNTKLQTLNLEGNSNLTTLNLGNNSQLKTLNVPMCGLTALDPSALTQLTSLNCSYNQLSSLDVTHNTALVDLNFTSNSVSSIDLSQNIDLEYMNCGSNQLTSLNLSNNSKLRQVNCQDNQIGELDFSNKPDLVGVVCFDNQIKLAAMTQLVNSLYQNDAPPFFPITPLHNKASEGNEFSPELALTCLNRGWIPYVWDEAQGTVEYAIEINEELFPDANFRARLHRALFDANLDGLLQMSELTINSLSLDNAGIALTKGIEYFPMAKFIDISNNQVAEVVFTGNQKIRYVYCHNNQLKGKAIDDMIASLPTLPAFVDPGDAEGDLYAMWHTGEGNSFNTIQVAAAAAKGWVVRVHDAPSNGWGLYEGSDNIAFVSAKTKAACVSRFDTNGDGELSLAEAAAVTKTMLSNNPFQSGDSIDYFDEFKYFTGLGTSLPNQAFYNFKTLKTITLPEGLTSTGASCFQGCSALERATLASTIKTIDMLSFQNCTSLESIDLPEGLTHLTTQVFFGATALKRLDLPSTVQYVGQNAFASCSNLEEVTYSGSALRISDRTFMNCSKLATFPFEHVTSIDYKAFQNTALTHVTIPETCTNIGYDAFYNSNQSKSCTVELLRYSYDVYDNSSANSSKVGLHLPIVNSSSAMYIDRGYFHEAYNVTTQGRTSIHILIQPSFTDIAFFSCERPMRTTSNLIKGYYIESFDQQRQVFVAKPVRGNLLPENTGLILRGLSTQAINHFLQAANDEQYYPSSNLLSPWTVSDTLINAGENINFMWSIDFNSMGGEALVSAHAMLDPIWVGEGSCYISLPPSTFGNGGISMGTKYEVVFEDGGMPGDANEDSKVDVLDVTTMINYILNKNPNPFNYNNANVNGDAKVDVLDVTLIINIILGLG